jgi:hypothetical protein
MHCTGRNSKTSSAIVVASRKENPLPAPATTAGREQLPKAAHTRRRTPIQPFTEQTETPYHPTFRKNEYQSGHQRGEGGPSSANSPTSTGGVHTGGPPGAQDAGDGMLHPERLHYPDVDEARSVNLVNPHPILVMFNPRFMIILSMEFSGWVNPYQNYINTTFS